MNPGAVLVETNWVVDMVAPAHLKNPQAVQLLSRADAGEFEIHVPAICFTEARETIPRRFAPRSRSEDFRKFVRWARGEGRVSLDDAQAAFRLFDQFDSLVGQELAQSSANLEKLSEHPRLKVFPLSEQMLQYQIEIGSLGLSIKPYDLAILAAVLTKALELREQGAGWIVFCELDSDLQPWDKTGARKPTLSGLYEKASLPVYGDFLLEAID